MEVVNKNGDIIRSDFISGKFDIQKVKEIITNDSTPLPGGYPKLWFNIYGGHLYITNLTGVTLHRYTI